MRLTFLSISRVDALIRTIAGGDLVYIVVHLTVGEALQRLAVGRVLFHPQQIVHSAPAAVVGGCSGGHITVVAFQTQMQVVAPETDTRPWYSDRNLPWIIIYLRDPVLRYFTDDRGYQYVFRYQQISVAGDPVFRVVR